MSKKFFSLIHGSAVHIAPETKIIPAEEFSALMNASEIIDNVKEDAKKYQLEVSSESEIIKERAQKEGYEAGFQEWVEKIAQLETEIQEVRQEVSKLVIPVALKAAKKIVGREIELSRDVIVDIVLSNLKAVAQHKKITIYINRKDQEALEAHRPRLKQIFESLEILSIRERSDIEPGGCIIETEGGIINAQLENQWHILETAFAKMQLKAAAPPL